MSDLSFVLYSLKHRFLNSFLSIMLTAFGVSIALLISQFGNHIENRINLDGKGIDIVVGAKGSPLQLILSSVYHIDIPTGNIPYNQAKKIMSNPQIEESIPLALGDNWKGFRIVGTTTNYIEHYKISLSEGRYWNENFEVVVGSSVNLDINDEFIGRFAIEAGVKSHSYLPNLIGDTVVNSLGSIAILSLVAGETWRANKKGITSFTIVIFLILLVGIISGIADIAVLNIVDSCMYTECEDFPRSYSIWYKFTTEALLLLFTPLMVMYILLHFDVIDTEAENNQWMTRIIVILMLLIVSSTMIELLQSFLPVSQMISSAILAMVVAIFIGWEERIMSSLIGEGESVSKKLKSLGELHETNIDDEELQVFSKLMGVLTTIIIILCWLYSSIVR